MSDRLVAVALGAWVDPEAAYVAWHEASAHSFWLDAGPAAADGWSWIGDGVREERPDRVRDVELDAASDPRGAGRFTGGWVGWLGYEDAAARAGAPISASDDDVPQELWIRVERFVAFDHATRRAWAFADPDAVEAYARDVAGARHPEPTARAAAARATGRHDPDDYAALVERCRDAIREGDAYQLCLTTRFTVAGGIDPVAAYRRLRTATPAHHGGLVVSDGLALASASPERFLDVEGDIVRTRPIKGTRPRGMDPVADAALASELRDSEKERAENVMIVDLMRNDLSRVCEPGSVGVDALLAVESYPAVHQLVSTVSGRLVDATTAGALLDATFPAGSMTGAPKLSAMTILNALEGAPRGVFAGCFGWVGDDGSLDLAMVIRSIVVRPGDAYVGAGGGITWRSDASAEVAEVGVKARGPLEALGAALPPGW